MLERGEPLSGGYAGATLFRRPDRIMVGKGFFRCWGCPGLRVVPIMRERVVSCASGPFREGRSMGLLVGHKGEGGGIVLA